MPGTHELILFIAAGLLLNLTPGADTLYIVSRSTAQGAGAGAVAALGIGAAYLLYLGATMLLTNAWQQPLREALPGACLARVFLGGVFLYFCFRLARSEG